jgi:hypothetical protein
MKISSKVNAALALLSAVVTLALAGCAHPTNPTAGAPALRAPWQAGMAEIDITPPVGFRMAGYFDERFSTGVHDPLKAKAMVLQQGGRQIALVFCDLIGLSLDISRPARERASGLTGIPVTNIIIAATHSHTGPLFDDVRGDYFHKEAIKKYGKDTHEVIDLPEFLRDRLVKVIVAAKANLRPSELEAGIATQKGISFNRRYLMKDGTLRTNPGLRNPKVIGPAGPIDPDVGILLVKHIGQPEPVGGLTVFAMHADTTSGTLFSADYPYGLQQTLRETFGGNYISAFAAGTSGNINHVDTSKPPGTRVNGADIAFQLGTTLGKTVLADVPDLTPIDHPDLGSRSETLMLPLQKVTPRDIAEAQVVLPRMADPHVDFFEKVRATTVLDLAHRPKIYPMEVQVFRLDKETAIVCLPAEIFVEFGLAIKAASPFKRTMVIEISNDRPSYVPTLKAFPQGGYEVMNSRVAPGGGEKMTEAAIKMLNELNRAP